MRAKKAASAVGLIAAGLVATQPATANNWGSGPPGGTQNSEISVGNNSDHRWSMHNGSNAWKDSLRAAAVGSYDPTDLTVIEHPNNVDDVDVRVDVGNHGSALNGWVYCPVDGITSGTDPTETCYRQWLKVDLDHVGNANADQRKGLMCHEFGHTLGLRHPTATHPDENASCMRQGLAMRSEELHAHDVTHLNDFYV